MNLKLIFLFVTLLLGCIRPDDEANERGEKVKEGMAIAKESLNKVLFGEPKGEGYIDLFLDTNYNLIDSLSRLPQHHTLEEYLLIFFQNLIVLSANKRADLIPQDFNERHPVFNDFIQELQKLADILASRGTRGITFKMLHKIFKTIKSDEFWIAIADLNEETAKTLKSEKDKSEL